MKPFKANLVTAIILILMGGWAYLSSETPSPTSLIPVAFGAVFLILHRWMQKENKTVAHIVVILTVLLLIALFKPLTSALDANDNIATIRVSIMILACIFAVSVYVKSFIDARKNKNA